MEKHSKKTPLIAKTSLSRKQYYKNLTLLKRAGLLIKRKGSSVYVLSIFGLVAYAALNLIKKGTLHSLSLKALDLLLSTVGEGEGEAVDADMNTRMGMVKTLIRDDQLQSIVLKYVV